MIVLVSKRRVHGFQLPFFHVRRLFHSISLHWCWGRIVSTFNNCDTSTTWSYIWIYRDGYCQASNEEVNMRPCAIFPKIYWTPELPTRKQHDFTCFYPIPTWKTNQSAINKSHMAHGQLWDRSWPVGLDFRPGHKYLEIRITWCNWMDHTSKLYLTYQWMLLDGWKYWIGLLYIADLLICAFHWFGTLKTPSALRAASLKTQAARKENNINFQLLQHLNLNSTSPWTWFSHTSENTCILISISMIHKRSYIVSSQTKLPLIIMAWPDLENDKRPGRSNPASNIKLWHVLLFSIQLENTKPIATRATNISKFAWKFWLLHIEIHRGSHKSGPGPNLWYDFTTDLLSCATMGLELCSWHLWITGRKAVLLVTDSVLKVAGWSNQSRKVTVHQCIIFKPNYFEQMSCWVHHLSFNFSFWFTK